MKNKAQKFLKDMFRMFYYVTCFKLEVHTVLIPAKMKLLQMIFLTPGLSPMASTTFHIPSHLPGVCSSQAAPWCVLFLTEAFHMTAVVAWRPGDPPWL